MLGEVDNEVHISDIGFVEHAHRRIVEDVGAVPDHGVDIFALLIDGRVIDDGRPVRLTVERCMDTGSDKTIRLWKRNIHDS